MSRVRAATHTVTAGLVAWVDQWPGVNTIKALLDKEPVVMKRPRHSFRDRPERSWSHGAEASTQPSFDLGPGRSAVRIGERQ